MKKILAAAAVAAGLFAAMPSSADVVNIADTLYVDTDDASLWQEANGEAGLQRDGDNPDTRLA